MLHALDVVSHQQEVDFLHGCEKTGQGFVCLMSDLFQDFTFVFSLAEMESVLGQR